MQENSSLDLRRSVHLDFTGGLQRPRHHIVKIAAITIVPALSFYNLTFDSGLKPFIAYAVVILKCSSLTYCSYNVHRFITFEYPHVGIYTCSSKITASKLNFIVAYHYHHVTDIYRYYA